jgi:hypothetical protein
MELLDMFICNGLKFNDLDEALDYANLYFDLNRVILGIEEVNYNG